MDNNCKLQISVQQILMVNYLLVVEKLVNLYENVTFLGKTKMPESIIYCLTLGTVSLIDMHNDHTCLKINLD